MVCACLLSKLACGHEFWVEPSDYAPNPGDPLFVRLNVGQGWVGKPFPRTEGLLDRFVISGPAGESPIPGIEGSDPAGMVRPNSEGVHVLGYQSHPYKIEIEPATFERYLLEEGLDSIRLLRQHEGTTHRPGLEKFSRSAKSFIQVGSGEIAVSPNSLGFRIELVPELESFPLRVGDEISVELLFEGKPLVGALVSAFSQTSPEDKRSHRSNGEGRAVFRLNIPGPWMIKSVHMIPSDGEVEWESFWATLTFQVEGNGK